MELILKTISIDRTNREIKEETEKTINADNPMDLFIELMGDEFIKWKGEEQCS